MWVNPMFPSEVVYKNGQTIILPDGFRERNARLYQLDFLNDRDEYVSDQMREDAKVINRSVAWMCNDKSKLPEVLRSYRSRIVPTYGVIQEGKFVPLGRRVRRLEDLLAHYTLIVKPIFGSDGMKVESYHGRQSVEKVLKQDETVVTEKVPNPKYSADIWDGCTNTIRIVTMHLPKEPNFVSAAIHRFGQDGTGATDNWDQGGLSARIDLQTGEMSRAARATGEAPVWYAKHPDTGGQIEGVQIPNWRYILGEVLEMAESVRELAHVGWDIVLNDTDFTVLEMNSNAGVCSIQVHGGLLLNDRVREFYQHHGITC